VARIVKRRISQPEDRVEELLFDLSGGRNAESATNPVVVLVQFVVKTRDIGRIAQHHGRDLSGQMAHIVSPQRTLVAAEALRPVPLKVQQDPCRLQAAAGEHKVARVQAGI